MFVHLISLLTASTLAVTSPGANAPAPNLHLQGATYGVPALGGSAAERLAGWPEADLTAGGCLVRATYSLTSGDCQAEFNAMYDALDNYDEAAIVFGVSSLGGPGPVFLAGVHLLYRARAVTKAEGRLDACLAKK